MNPTRHPGPGPTPPPETDSEDFSDTEAASAIVTTTVEDFAQHAARLPETEAICSACAFPKRLLPKEHAFRRWKGHIYSRAIYDCGWGHTTTRVFQVDWLKR